MSKYKKLWTDEDIDWSDHRYDRKKHERQRIKRGFSDYDGWSFDTYIAVVISNYAKWHRTKAPGYPSGMSEEEWYKVLRKIEFGFANYADNKFTSVGKEIEGFDTAMKLFKKYFGSLWT